MPENFSKSTALAFSASFTDSESRFEWAGNNAHALEYSPDPDRLDLLPEKVIPILRTGIPVRYHTRYFEYEMGHADKHEAQLSLQVHMETLKKIQGLGEPVVTVHVGLSPHLPVNNDHIVENLSRLVEFGQKLGITICLENQRKGHGSNPYNILKWATASGAMITLDLGHAMGCAMVMNQEISVVQMMDLFNSRIFEAHIYGLEDESGHHPILDMDPVKPLIDRLLQTDCRW